MLDPVARERTAVLVVRAWCEGEAPADLRARVTSVVDVELGCESTAVLAGRDAILDYTQHWLDAVMADQACAK
jgi:hypothetical protein